MINAQFHCDYIWDVGCRRTVNQDSLLILPECGLFSVADGLGGHRGGEIASALSISELTRSIKSSNFGLASLEQAFQRASEHIKQTADTSPELQGMCTTLTAAWIQPESDHYRLYIGQVGDSRCYLLTDKNCFQLTRDHSWIQEQVLLGSLTREQAARMPGKNILVRSVGMEPMCHTDLFELEIQPGCAIFLCSDGLHNKLTDQEIQQFAGVTGPEKLREGMEKLLRLAKERGGEDNITAICIQL
jgi:protein phosphatase